MRTTIYIPDDLVEGIKEKAWSLKLSVSGYFVNLHRKSLPISPTLGTKQGAPEKTVSVAQSQANIGDPRFAVEAKSEKYKEKNPNEICGNCHKALKYCFC